MAPAARAANGAPARAPSGSPVKAQHQGAAPGPSPGGARGSRAKAAGGGGGGGGAPGALSAEQALLIVFAGNLIGVACARSLHFQFYAWCARAQGKRGLPPPTHVSCVPTSCAARQRPAWPGGAVRVCRRAAVVVAGRCCSRVGRCEGERLRACARRCTRARPTGLARICASQWPPRWQIGGFARMALCFCLRRSRGSHLLWGVRVAACRLRRRVARARRSNGAARRAPQVRAQPAGAAVGHAPGCRGQAGPVAGDRADVEHVPVNARVLALARRLPRRPAGRALAAPAAAARRRQGAAGVAARPPPA
jgi:hypothetical protein